ncbi:hypothetical protein Hanom_Chr03g00233651 [Helianthus anomalus]
MLWKAWFAELDVWMGVPTHLLENSVFDIIFSQFGKIIHRSQLSLEDADLSVECEGVLVDRGDRINTPVMLKWRDRSYRVCQRR